RDQNERERERERGFERERERDQERGRELRSEPIREKDEPAASPRKHLDFGIGGPNAPLTSSSLPSSPHTDQRPIEHEGISRSRSFTEEEMIGMAHSRTRIDPYSSGNSMYPIHREEELPVDRPRSKSFAYED